MNVDWKQNNEMKLNEGSLKNKNIFEMKIITFEWKCVWWWKIMAIIKMFVWWLRLIDGFFTEFSNEFMNGRVFLMFKYVNIYACMRAWTIWNEKQNNEMKLNEGSLKCENIFEMKIITFEWKCVLMIVFDDRH